MAIRCTTCGKTFTKEAGLIQHCKDKQHPHPSTEPHAPTPVPAFRPPVPVLSSSTAGASRIGANSPFSTIAAHECRPCGMTFPDKAAYDVHFASRHLTKPYKCTPCGLDFSSSEALAVHFRHFAVHPKCGVCAAAFLDQRQLDLHGAAHPKCARCGTVCLGRMQLEEVRHGVRACGACLGVGWARGADELFLVWME